MVTFNPELSIGDLLTFCVLLIASIGLFLNLFQMRREYKQKRAEYIISLYKDFISDEKIMDTFYKIENSQLTDYDESDRSDRQRQIEEKLDILLGYFENIAELHRMKGITRRDLRVFAYEFLIVFRNESVQKHLKSVETWCGEKEIKEKGWPYKELKKVAKKIKKKYTVKPAKRS